jgi:hypothetical protein
MLCGTYEHTKPHQHYREPKKRHDKNGAEWLLLGYPIALARPYFWFIHVRLVPCSIALEFS